MEHKTSELHLRDINEGDSFSFEQTLTERMIDDFAALSGDYSPIHMDNSFAIERGFSGRVAHGALLAGLLSRLVGVHFPGRNALLQTMNLKFHAPAFPGDTLQISAVAEHVSEAAGVIMLKAVISNSATTQKLLSAGIQVGFTNRAS